MDESKNSLFVGKREMKKELTIALYSQHEIPISNMFEVLIYKVKSIPFYLDSDGYYKIDAGDYFYRYLPLYAEAWQIKRSSDNKIYTIGDKHPEKNVPIQRFYLTSLVEISYEGFSQGLNYCK